MTDYAEAVDELFGTAEQRLRGVTQPAQMATQLGVSDIDEDPEQAGRSIQLSRYTGVPAPVIHSDMEHFERGHKSQLISEIIRNNEHIQNYINSYPMASKVSNDDYANLDPLSNAVRKVVHTAMDKGWEGVKEGFGEEALLPEENVKHAARTLGLNPDNPTHTGFLRESALAKTATAANIFLRSINAAVHGLAKGGGSLLSQVTGVDERRSEREIGSMLEWAMQRGDIRLNADPHVAREVDRLVNQAGPYIAAGEVPPPGVSAWLDHIKVMQAKEDAAGLKEAMSAAQKTNTIARSPEALEEFLRPQVENRVIGISADGVRELYKDKLPTPDDGLLGWVPNIEQQLRVAERTGGDIEVPLATWLARADSETAHALEDHIRVRKDGLTPKEATEVKGPMAIERPEPTTLEETVRREAGFEPLAQVGQRELRLERGKQKVTLAGDKYDYFTLLDQGKNVGEVTIQETSKGVLYIGNIKTYEGGGANAFGIHAVRQLMEELRREYPNATAVGGWRVSGARGKIGKNEWAQASLRAKPEEFAEALAPVLGWDKVDTNVPREAKPGTQTTQVTPNVAADWRPTDLYTAREKDISRAVGELVNRIAPGLEFRTVDYLKGQAGATGQKGGYGGIYFPETNKTYPLILVALAEADLRTVGSALHETIHHLRSGFFTKEEWAFLEKEATDKGWAAKHGIESRYLLAPKWLKLEESIAEEFRAWAENRLRTEELSPEIRTIFQRMKDFFAKVAETVKEVFGKNITVEQLFEQVASGEIGRRTPVEEQGKARFATALAQATEVEEANLFARASAIGMTEPQFKKYMKLIEERRVEDEARAKARADRAAAVTKTEQWKEAEPKVREEVTAAVNDRQDIVADEFFRRGMLNGERIRRQKMNGKYLTPEQKKALGPEVYTDKGGINPFDMAGLFGFFSAEEMIAALTKLQGSRQQLGLTAAAYKAKLIRDRFDATMNRRYGLPEHDQLLKEAREDIQTETQMDMLAEETFALATKAKQATPLTKEGMKAAVAEEFSKTPIAQAKQMDRYLRDAGRAGKYAELHLLKDDPTEAFRWKQRQFISALLADQAKRLGKEVDRNEAFLKRFSARQLSTVDQDYTNQIHGIMRQIGAPIKRSVQDLEASLVGAPLERFVAAKEADLREVPVAEFLFDKGFSKSIEQMTVEEFRDVDRSLKVLAHNGRSEMQVNKAGEKADLDVVKQTMIEQLQTFKPAEAVPLRQGTGGVLGLPKGGPKKLIRTFIAAHLQMENLLNRWDRWDPKGAFNQYVMRPLSEGSNRLAAMERNYSAQLAKLRDKTDLKEVVDNPILRDPLTKSPDNPIGEPFRLTRRNFRAVLSNVGNESNLDKLARGYEVSPDVLMQWVHSVATKADWDFAQGLGDIFAAIKKESDRMYERLTGIAPEALEIKPISTPFGTYPGWYHPVIYDSLREGTSKRLMGPNALEEAEYYRATTSANYTKARTKYAAPISLHMDEVTSRMKQMLNDIAMREPVINASKFFYDKDLRAAIAKHSALGPEVKDSLIPYLKDVANAANIDSAAAGIGAMWSEWFRQNVISTLIGLNPGTVMKHGTTALVQSMQEVGWANFAAETKTLFSRLPSGESNWRFAMNTSEELQRRHRHYAETLGGGYQEAFQEPSIRAFIQHMGSYPVATSDLLSAVPTWLAEYKKEMTAGGTHGDAIFAGDRAVRRAHGSTAQTNRAAIMRGGAVSQWMTSLFGFFNHIMNRQVELVWRAMDTVEKAKGGYIPGAATSLLTGTKIAISDTAKVLVPGLFAYILWPAFVEEMVTPLPHNEKESWAMWSAKALTKNLSASWIGFRDIVQALLTGHDPTMGLIGVMATGARDVVRDVTAVATKGQDRAGKLMKHGAVVLGSLTGLVNAQIGKTGEFVYNVFRGKDRPKKIGGPLMNTPDSWLRGLRYGESKQPKHR